MRTTTASRTPRSSNFGHCAQNTNSEMLAAARFVMADRPRSTLAAQASRCDAALRHGAHGQVLQLALSPVRSERVNIALWVVSGVLAAMYLGAGTFKLVTPKAKLAAKPGFEFAAELPNGLVPFIGLAEVAGAIGLILPWSTHIAPVLTPLAGVGLAVLQLCAIVFHGRRGEFKQWPVNVVLLLLAAFVAYGRWVQLSAYHDSA
jgi:hypothetical protein